MTIQFLTSVEHIQAHQLQGFFVDWPNPPSPETHLRLLRQSDEVVLALDQETGQVVGFVTALTDRVLSAYIPLLEVLPVYQGQGIGQELMQRMLQRLRELYMVDLVCDPALVPFYQALGMQPATAMILRRYERQAGPAPKGSGGDEP